MRIKPLGQITLILLVIVGAAIACTASVYGNPPKDLQASALVGVWEVHYGRHEVDRLILREDGTYKQQYQDTDANYAFETDWNSFWLEYLPDGRVHIHFEGGRYYVAGIRIAELDGWGDPCPSELPDCFSGNHPRIFYDPYTEKRVEMVKELVLTIRVDSRGNIVFHHMVTSLEGKFAILGGQSEIFRRIDDLTPLENIDE